MSFLKSNFFFIIAKGMIKTPYTDLHYQIINFSLYVCIL